MMNYYCFAPPESLKQFVRCFWVFESNFESNPYVYRSMADGCVELLFHYKGIFTDLDNGDAAHSTLHAQTKQHRRFIIHEQFGIFGAYLYPFAVPLLFDFPAHLATDTAYDLPALLGAAGRELEERIITADGNGARKKLLISFLEKKLLNKYADNDAAFSAIRHVIDAKNIESIPQLSGMYCMTERTLQRHFKDYAGLSPKLLHRISRFKTALNDLGSQHKLLTEIAYECGYYDQSHFISDFKSFSGYHPKEYFHGRPEGAEWRAR